MNLNDLAKAIAEKEGKKISLSIAQIKEVLKITFIELSYKRPSDVLATIERYGEQNALKK